MTLNDLDEHCNRIFEFILQIDKPITVLELHRTLNATGFKISKPTLFAHLKHLLKQKLIKKRKEGKQKIAISINYKIPSELIDFKEATKTLMQIKDDKKFFDRLTIAEKISTISQMLFIIELKRLKTEIYVCYEPEKRHEAFLNYLFTQNYLQEFRIHMLRSCANSKTDAMIALDEVERLEEILRKNIFS
jgi:hypothetical protein